MFEGRALAVGRYDFLSQNVAISGYVSLAFATLNFQIDLRLNTFGFSAEVAATYWLWMFPWIYLKIIPAPGDRNSRGNLLSANYLFIDTAQQIPSSYFCRKD